MNRHAQQAAARFDDWSSTYGKDRISPWFRFYQTLALSKLDIEGGSGFLDVGCGTGWAVREAAKHLQAGCACGIDISPRMIENARSQTPDTQNIEFQVANAESIPYPDKTFSSIICTCSFHHYADAVDALMEIRRVMKRCGKFVLLDSARDVSLPIWLQDRWRRYLERSHVRYYTTKEIKELLKASGLNLIGDVLTIRKFMDHRKVFTGLMLAECEK